MEASIRKILEKHLRGTDEAMENAIHEIFMLTDSVCPACKSYKTRVYGDSPKECLKCGNIYFYSK